MKNKNDYLKKKKDSMSYTNTKNDKQTKYTCPQCKETVYEDQHLLELYCQHCGLVIQTTEI